MQRRCIVCLNAFKGWCSCTAPCMLSLFFGENLLKAEDPPLAVNGIGGSVLQRQRCQHAPNARFTAHHTHCLPAAEGRCRCCGSRRLTRCCVNRSILAYLHQVLVLAACWRMLALLLLSRVEMMMGAALLALLEASAPQQVSPWAEKSYGEHMLLLGLLAAGHRLAPG